MLRKFDKVNVINDRFDAMLAMFSKSEWDALDYEAKRSVLARRNVYVRGNAPQAIGGVRGWNEAELERILDLYQKRICIGKFHFAKACRRTQLSNRTSRSDLSMREGKGSPRKG